MRNPFRRNSGMALRTLLDRHGFESISIGAGFVQARIRLTDANRGAAWELYVELLTRIATQPLPYHDGDDKTALDSVYAVFPMTREILRRHGPNAADFSKVAIPVLNQVVRPFTAKWHRLSLEGAFEDDARKHEFRDELAALQKRLRNYSRMLAEMAGVEDLTNLETTGGEK